MSLVSVLVRWLLMSVVPVFLCGCVAAGGAPGRSAALDGATLFMACAGCHSLGPGAGHRVGPNLGGLAGRRSGSLEGFAWSPAMAASDFEWTPQLLSAWIMTAETMVPGTWMLYHNDLSVGEVETLVDYIFSQAP